MERILFYNARLCLHSNPYGCIVQSNHAKIMSNWITVDFFVQNPLNIMFAALAVGSAALLLWQSLASRNVSSVSVTQASMLISARAQIIDVREVEAYVSGHIKNAKSLPFSQIASQLPLLKLKKDKPVLLVCERGSVGTKAVAIFKKNEFTDVHVLDLGLKAWREAQLPLVKD